GDAQQRRLARPEEPERLVAHRRLGALPADEPLHRPVGQDERPVAGLRARRALGPHDRGQHVRRPAAAQLLGLVLGRAVHGIARSVRNGRPWTTRQTFAGVSGMSACRTPYGRSASTTALTIAAGEPTVADSPTPLAPSGWCGDGVTVSPSSHDGYSTAVGSR